MAASKKELKEKLKALLEDGQPSSRLSPSLLDRGFALDFCQEEARLKHRILKIKQQRRKAQQLSCFRIFDIFFVFLRRATSLQGRVCGGSVDVESSRLRFA